MYRLEAVATVLGALSVITGAVALVFRRLWRFLRTASQFFEDWNGAPARPGHNERPGVPERMRRIEMELRPNGGSSLRDAIDVQGRAIARVEVTLDDHLRYHGVAEVVDTTLRAAAHNGASLVKPSPDVPE